MIRDLTLEPDQVPDLQAPPECDKHKENLRETLINE